MKGIHKLLSILCVLGTFFTTAYANVEQRFNRINTDPNALYMFLKKMPKGGELHYHLTGGAYPETLIWLAKTQPYCFDKKTLAAVPSSESSICTGFSGEAINQDTVLYEKVLRAWSMKDFIPGEESGHDHFFQTFPKFSYLASKNYVPLLAEVMQRAANQNELYLEVMILPFHSVSPKTLTLNQDWDAFHKKLLADTSFMQTIQKIVTDIDNLVPAAKRYAGCEKSVDQSVCQLTVRFQHYILREQALPEFFYQAVQAFEAASRSPAIVGINIVQREDSPLALRQYEQQMTILDYLHRRYPKVNIAIHAGELSPEEGAVPPQDLRFHISSAIHQGHAQRIGHGVSIAFEDKAEETLNFMRENKLPVEINLTSNEKILKIDFKNHPILLYLTHGVPVILSTDDEGVLRTDLTSEYVKAVLEHHLTYDQLKQISRNALSFSFLPGKSLWTDINEGQRIVSCLDLFSPTCLGFVKMNEKARLQRLLELNFLNFEKGEI